ncbi:monovalent cation/H+ antiporter complex subunit F [Actinomadura adrarensis]|uniref:Monovalent cation/H+ antiporter complex subunit F n=1 Tax=Actinomadura adrarensis TaxID=1819600 RepID=A0ABW3CFI3_9ACTN
MLVAAIVALFVAMLLTLVRAFLGPGLYNRILAINTFGTKTVLFIAVLGTISGRPHLFEIAVVYALVNFVTTIAVLRFTHRDDLRGGPGAPDEEPAR